MSSPARPPKGGQFAYETAIRSLDDQLRRIESLDSKAGILIGAGGILAALLAGGGSPILEGSRHLALATTVLLNASVTLALLAFFNRSYSSGLSPHSSPRWLGWAMRLSDGGSRGTSIGVSTRMTGGSAGKLGSSVRRWPASSGRH